MTSRRGQSSAPSCKGVSQSAGTQGLSPSAGKSVPFDSSFKNVPNDYITNGNADVMAPTAKTRQSEQGFFKQNGAAG